MPTVWTDCSEGARRGADGSYPNWAMARRTFSLVSSLMEGWFLQVLDTVEGDTPARAATSLMVTAISNFVTSWDYLTDFC